MVKGVSVRLFPAGKPFHDLLTAAREAGFEVLEVMVGLEGELSLGADECTFRRAGEQAREAGLEIAAVASELWWDRPLTATDAAGRQAAAELALALLDRARWLGAGVLAVVPGMVSHFAHPGRRLKPYAEALASSSLALAELVMPAEDRGVVLAVENARNGMLLSPMEMREFIDRLHTPWVAACLDVHEAARLGFVEDWIEMLAGRIAVLRISGMLAASSPAEGCVGSNGRAVERSAVAAALAGVRYDGPVIASGRADPAEASRELDLLMAAAGGREDGL